MQSRARKDEVKKLAKLPKVSAREISKILINQGWHLSKPPRGSHAVYIRNGDTSTAITVILKKEISRGTLNQIIKKKGKIVGKSKEEIIREL